MVCQHSKLFSQESVKKISVLLVQAAKLHGLAGMASLHGRTTGEDIFGGVNSVLENLDVQWSKLASVTTDRAPAMTGRTSGFIAHLRSHLQGLGIPTVSICITAYFTRNLFVLES